MPGPVQLPNGTMQILIATTADEMNWSFDHGRPALLERPATEQGRSVCSAAPVRRREGIRIDRAAYVVARPDKNITTRTGLEVEHLRADAFELSVGLTFGVWKNR